jgi:hypothetical protein
MITKRSKQYVTTATATTVTTTTTNNNNKKPSRTRFLIPVIVRNTL